MVYTQEDLERLQKEYNDNFELLLKHIDTPEHKHYSDEEKKLYKKEVEIRKQLGLYIKDPCQIRSHKFCYECTGYYIVIPSRNKNGKMIYTGIDVPKETEGAVKCNFKKPNWSLYPEERLV